MLRQRPKLCQLGSCAFKNQKLLSGNILPSHPIYRGPWLSCNCQLSSTKGFKLTRRRIAGATPLVVETPPCEQ
jgi:hypothetical protein